MAFKKGFCTHCKGDERSRIFEVNKDAEVCYCTHCTHAMAPKEAMNNFTWLISSYLKKASKALFESTDYLYAYQLFAHVIDLDENAKVAYFGRILSLVYLSTLRTSKIALALQLHRQQAKLFHYQETAREHFHFLWLLLDALDRYYVRMKKRIQNHNIYYDEDCIKLYLKRTDEIKKYREFLIKEAEFFVESNKEQYSVIVDRIKNGADEYDNAFKQRFVDAEGHSYLFDGFDKNENPILIIQSHIPPQNVHSFKPLTLYAKDNKKSLIKDEIYLNNLTLSRLVKISIPLAIFLLVTVVAGMVASFIIDDNTVKLLLYIASALLLAASFLLVILHFAWKKSLKKKYYNGTNPFILR